MLTTVSFYIKNILLKDFSYKERLNLKTVPFMKMGAFDWSNKEGVISPNPDFFRCWLRWVLLAVAGHEWLSD